jgi:hypothetical protein
MTTDASRVTVPRDHPCEVVLIDKETGTVAHREPTTAEVLDGCLTRIRITWNALAVTGGVRWFNPGTGRTYPRGLSFRIETTHPVTGEPVEIAH